MVDFKPQRIGQMLGLSDNPLYQSFGNNRNAFIQGFAGIGSDPMNPGGGFSRGFATGSLLDTQMAEQQQAQAQEAEQTNMTKEWLRQRGRDDLIPLVDAGQGMFALQQATQAPESNLTADMQNYQFAQENPGFASFIGQGNQPSAPSGYSWNGNGGLAFIPGGPADPAMAANKPPGEAERKAGALTTVTEQDAARLFGDGTAENPGIFEALGNTGDQMLQAGGFGINPLAGFASSDYKVAKDSISNIAQSYLYAMSGATAPPEEVRKITEQVTPMPLDSPAQKLAKRERLMAMYAAIEGAQGNAARQPQNGGWVDAGNGIRIRELP